MAGFGRRRDDALSLALASGQTLREAAVVAGISERTAARRWADQEFKARVAELRSELTSRAAALVSDGMIEAATVLRDLLKAKKESVRLGACRALLEHGIKLRESVDFEQRLKALEKAEVKT